MSPIGEQAGNPMAAKGGIGEQAAAPKKVAKKKKPAKKTAKKAVKKAPKKTAKKAAKKKKR